MGASEEDALLGGGSNPPVPGWNPSARRAWRDTYWLYWWLVNFALATAISLALAVILKRLLGSRSRYVIGW